MPTFDATAKAHLDSGAPTKPIFLAYLDILGDPIRATTLGYAVTLPVLADPDLSGQTFLPTAGVVTVGDVEHGEGGSETLPVELSGLLLPDTDLLNTLGDRLNWQGRRARLWVILRDETRAQQGAIAEFYTGYMSSLRLLPRRDSQVIRLEIEGYRALLNQASNRSYLDQKRYDAADTSAAATIGAANGVKTGPRGGAGEGSRGVGGRAVDLNHFLRAH